MQTELIFNRMIVLGKSIKIFLNKIIGPLVFVWLVYSIGRQIINQPNLPESVRYIRESVGGSYAVQFWSCIALVLVNWGLEARKWQMMLQPLQQVSFGQAFRGVLAGVAFAINTPNRVGEYGGRMLFLRTGNRLESIALTMLASASQLIVTLVFGGIAMAAMQDKLLKITGAAAAKWLPLFYFILLAGSIVGVFFYFRIKYLPLLLHKIPVARKLLPYLKVLNEIDVTILLRVLWLSTIRYLVFVSQYILLLQVMHVELPTIHAFGLISVLYLILALIPTIALVEVGLRGKIGIVLFSLYSTNTLGIYAATSGIWLLNLVIPALTGSLLAAGIKIFNTRK